MPRSKLSMPFERRKASLRSQEIRLRVRAAETKEQLQQIRSELSAMKGKKPAQLG